MLHDWDYERPILARYIDPLELIWLAFAPSFGCSRDGGSGASGHS